LKKIDKSQIILKNISKFI